MDITSETKQIMELFQMKNEKVYNVPIYQRNYSWKYDNIETLFNDILKENKGYYIGNLLVTPTNNYKDLKSFDIVDGQQRLTTIALILLAINHVLLEKEDDLDKNIDSDIYEKIITNRQDIKRQLLYSNESLKDQSRLILLDEDMIIYEEFLKILNKDLDYTPYKNRKFGKRYHFIKDLIEDHFFKDDEYIKNENLSDSIDHLIEFYDKVNNLEILMIKVNNLTDAFSIFTSFNSKGLPLTLIDLLKSYYLKNALDYDSKYKTEEEALENWHKLISYFNDNNGEPKSSLVTQFLQNYYDTFESESTSSITKSQSLREYERLFSKKGGDYIESLIEGAEIFSSFTNNIGEVNETLDYTLPSSNDKNSKYINYYIKKLSLLETTSIYPIMLYLLYSYKSQKIKSKVLVENFKYLKSYFIRRNIVLKPKSSNLRAKALASVRKLSEEEDLNKNSLPIIKQYLNMIAPTDGEFKSSLVDGNIYDINSKTTRVILIDLERDQGAFFNKQRPDNLDSKNDKGKYIWTIEHIMPQSKNLSKNWKDSINYNGNLSDEDISVIHNDSIHKLGNLTLSGYNSEMSKKDFIDKRDYSPKYSNDYTGLKTKLFLNESIFNGNKNKSNWNQNDIENRTKSLADLVLQMNKID